MPLQQSGQLQFIEVQDGIRFTDNVHIRFVSGHTEAMMLPLINYNGKSILYIADLLPTVGHIPLPYIPAYDMFPLKTLAEKKIFLNEAAEKEIILFLEHDAVNECCTVHQTEKGVRLKQVFKLSDI